MPEKDTTQRVLFSYKDVYADICNGFLFKGENVIKENDLEPLETNISDYMTDDKLHTQVRDLGMYWKNQNLNIYLAMIGIENQSYIDSYMPLRVIGYDGASYRHQLDDNKGIFPVLTLVLYFGKKIWNKPKSLHDVFAIPEELKPYISDYKINIIDVNNITKGKLNRFNSDIKIYFDYIQAKNKQLKYKGLNQKIKHPEALLNAIQAFSNDNSFTNEYNKLTDNRIKGGEITMCDLVDGILKRGEERGEKRGLKQGEERGSKNTKENIILNMLKNNFTDEQIKIATKASDKTINELKKKLK